MVQITPEIQLALIGLCTALVGIPSAIVGAWAWSFRIRTKAEADAKINTAKIAQMEAEGKLKQVDALTEQTRNISQALTMQMVTNEKMEQKYTGIRVAQDSGMERLWYHVEDTGKKILSAIEKVPAATVQGFSAEAVGAFAEALGKQMSAVMVAEFEKRDAQRDMHPFPEAEDAAWEERFIVPRHDSVQMYKRPQSSDLVLLQKPCSYINVSGEMVRLVAGRVPGWYAIMKKDCWGWLHERSIEVRQLETVPG